jgi:CRISPR-associated endonuclease/helicase Cas3
VKHQYVRLLAKSSETAEKPKAQELLRGHTMLVHRAARLLLLSRGDQMLRAAGLKVDYARFEKITLASAFMHDLGKCSEHFQAMLRRIGKHQLVRHEAVSLWLVWPGQPLASWLTGAFAKPQDLMIAAVAAAGHHRKFYDMAFGNKDHAVGLDMSLLTNHPDFVELLRFGAKAFKLEAPPTLPGLQVSVARGRSIETEFDGWKRDWEDIEHESERDVLTAVVKAIVIAADVAGSALVDSQKSGGVNEVAAASAKSLADSFVPSQMKLDWITKALSRRATQEEMRDIVARRLDKNRLRPFQSNVGASRAQITFVRAGCGSGKTLAAYHWAAEQHPGKQLWVTYPTTGTTTEGYRDYVERADIVARLEHGRRLVDIKIFGIAGEGDLGEQRSRDRLDALRVWESPVITCTVDVVLGLVQNHRKGLYAWPSICDSAIVFDEIHSYDDKLFGCLVRFLRALPGVPTMLMTASLPERRMVELRKISKEIHGVSLLEIDGPADLEGIPRYVRSNATPIDAARECLASGGKVLWVSNTVARCIAVQDAMPEAKLYHSRFKYGDRVERHQEAIEAFKGTGACLLSATQVAEMSLDLSADLLITDAAPIPSLIQRLGRLNRRATAQNPGTPKPFIVIHPPDERPYTKVQFVYAEAWLKKLGDSTLSQKDLSDAWLDELDDAGQMTSSQQPSAWLDDAFETKQGECREVSPGITIILSDDVILARRSHVHTLECAIPMNQPPRALRWQDWPQVNFIPIAPCKAILYSRTRGAEWRK